MAIRHRKELREDPSMKVTRIGLDIAKQIYELHGVDRRGRVVVRKTLRRPRDLPMPDDYFDLAVGRKENAVRLAVSRSEN